MLTNGRVRAINSADFNNPGKEGDELGTKR